MHQGKWIKCFLNLGLCCSIITCKDSFPEEKLMVTRVRGGTNAPNFEHFEARESTLWRKSSGFPKGESISPGKELAVNENKDLSTFSFSTLPSTFAASSYDEVTSTDERKMNRKWSKNIDQEEKNLLHYLMHGYDKDVRPVRKASQPILIEVGITLTQIFDMDEKNQVLTTTVWLDQEWYDELLTWTPEDFYNITSIRLPCHKIWLPDIVLYNSADDYTRGYFASRAMVNHDGKIFWPPPTKFRSTCQVDVSFFPFDDQICKLKLGSWTYNGFQVDVTNRTTEVDLSNYISSGEWELLGAELQRNVVYYSCCPEPFPDVTITLTIRRKTLFYVFNVIIPCILLSFLTLLVFFLPPDSGEKVALGITVLLAFSVFMLAIAEKMPETSESIPLIGIYLTAVMIITSISVVVTVIVLNLHYLGPRVETVPNWLRYLLPNEDKEFIRRQRSDMAASFPFEMEQTSSTGGNRIKQVLISHHQEGCPAPSVTTCLNAPPQIHVETIVRVPPSNIVDEDVSRNEDDSTESYNLRNRTYNYRPSHQHGSNNHSESLPNSTLPQFTASPLTDFQGQDEIAKSLRYLLQKQVETEQQHILISEWRLAAQVVDRILFWVFFLITLVSSGIFLVMLPFYKRTWSGPMPPHYS